MAHSGQYHAKPIDVPADPVPDAQGSSAAFNGLGVLAMQGQGLPRNHTLAKMAFERGAALGDMDCIFNLGMMYSGAGICAHIMFTSCVSCGAACITWSDSPGTTSAPFRVQAQGSASTLSLRAGLCPPGDGNCSAVEADQPTPAGMHWVMLRRPHRQGDVSLQAGMGWSRMTPQR